MYPILFQFGPITIYSFGAFMALAALCAAWVVSAELRRHQYDPERASSMVFAAAIGGLIGARSPLTSSNREPFGDVWTNFFFTATFLLS